MNFYKRHIGDYLKDTAHLSLLEHGVYTRLLDVYYTRESGIPEAQAARLVGARSKEELAALAAVLEEFFKLEDGLWIQLRCEQEIKDAEVQAKANRENGRKGGRRKAFASPPSSENTTQSEPNENPLGSDSLGEKNLSHKPVAISHKPLEEEQQQASAAVVLPTGDGYSSPVVKRATAIAVFLRQRGVPGAYSANPNIQGWADDARVTDETLDAAISKARSRLGSKPPGVNYLVPIIADLLNPKPVQVKREDTAWKRSNPGIESKASELGLIPRNGESYEQLRERCESEMRRRAQGVAA